MFPGRFASSPSKEKLNSEDAFSTQATSIFKPQSKGIGNQCLVLPEVSDSNFTRLIGKNCYVDKTEYLNKMVSRTAIFWFLARPRRFGKTLLISTMEAFFTGEKELFKGTEIYLRRPGDWPKYPTIRLDFSYGISSESPLEFKRTLLAALEDEAKKHNIHLDTPDVTTATKRLIEQLSEKYKLPVVILIDEYDSSYTESYAHDKDEAAKILRTKQSFYKTLKGASNKIHFCFVTGITRLALSDFFSGYNAAIDLTMDPDYAGIVGFNVTEICQYFGSHIKHVAEVSGKTEKDVLETIRTWHDGFRFTTKNESLYSPVSVIGYLRSDGASISSWSGTGGNSQFFVQRLRTFAQEALEILIKDEINGEADKQEKKQLITAKGVELRGKYNFEGSTGSQGLEVFLYHSGYLSIRDYDNATDTYSLQFSNLELKNDFAQYLCHSFTGMKPSDMDKLVNSMVRDLDKHQWEPFIEKLNSFFSRIPYQLITNQRKNIEAFFHLTLFLIFKFCTDSRLYRTQPLMEDSTNKGRADFVITIGNTRFVIEPKMDNNPENPVYECKEKYLHAHLFGSTEYVVCFGLKFRQTGVVNRWGEATFSKKGELLQEAGEIRLTALFNKEEKTNIINQLRDFQKNHPTFTLQPDKLIEFLQQIGPTITDEESFVEKFTEDKETLCLLLEKIKKPLPKSKDYFKDIINRLIKRFGPKSDKKTRQKLKNI